MINNARPIEFVNIITAYKCSKLDELIRYSTILVQHPFPVLRTWHRNGLILAERLLCTKSFSLSSEFLMLDVGAFSVAKKSVEFNKSLLSLAMQLQHSSLFWIRSQICSLLCINVRRTLMKLFCWSAKRCIFVKCISISPNVMIESDRHSPQVIQIETISKLELGINVKRKIKNIV